MKTKYYLFSGIILLTSGVLLKIFTQIETLGITLIIIGVLCKFIYIIKKVKNGEYKPGKELVVLIIGLVLFFIGMYFIDSNYKIIRLVLIVLAITLKTIFILRFIQNIRSGKKLGSSLK